MARHRQKDEEAGAEGCGVLNTRKRMWKDADGNIVTKKPTLAFDTAVEPSAAIQAAPLQQPQVENTFQSPISQSSHDPDHSLCHSTPNDCDSGIASGGYPPTNIDVNALSVVSGSYSPIDQHFWSSNFPQVLQPQPAPEPESFSSLTAFGDAHFDDIFNPDTASSFNNPFTTMNNYNWLFDVELSRPNQQMDSVDHFTPFQFNGNAVNQPSHAFDLQLDHMTMEKPLSTAAHYGSGQSHKTNSPQQTSPSNALITPPLTKEIFQISRRVSVQGDSSEPRNLDTTSGHVSRQPNNSRLALDIERPMSMLQPSRCLPIIDELARAQILDLINITLPKAPDGSFVTSDNPLLSLSCLQTYCDLFFTRFNTAYPLIHMSTFDPSHVDTLLLTSILLLGATYGEKDAHQLAVSLIRSYIPPADSTSTMISRDSAPEGYLSLFQNIFR